MVLARILRDGRKPKGDTMNGSGKGGHAKKAAKKAPAKKAAKKSAKKAAKKSAKKK